MINKETLWIGCLALASLLKLGVLHPVFYNPVIEDFPVEDIVMTNGLLKQQCLNSGIFLAKLYNKLNGCASNELALVVL